MATDALRAKGFYGEIARRLQRLISPQRSVGTFRRLLPLRTRKRTDGVRQTRGVMRSSGNGRCRPDGDVLPKAPLPHNERDKPFVHKQHRARHRRAVRRRISFVVFGCPGPCLCGSLFSPPNGKKYEHAAFSADATFCKPLILLYGFRKKHGVKVQWCNRCNAAFPKSAHI
jgi:hypothetical protein